MNGWAFLGPAVLVAQAAFAFDAPRLDGVAVDGAARDWGERGLRIERLTLHSGGAATVTPAAEGSGSLRVGWDQDGLLLLVSLPAPRAEDESGPPTINVVVRDGARPLNWWQAMLDLPPLKGPGNAVSPEARLMDHRYDQWADPREAREELAALAPLAIEGCWARSADGYVLEARLPWSNLGRAPGEGDTLRVQLQVWKGGPSLSWFPYGWGEKCPHYCHLVRLARDASPPATQPGAGLAPSRSGNVWHHGGFGLYIPEGLARVRGVYVTLPGNKHRTFVDESTRTSSAPGWRRIPTGASRCATRTPPAGGSATPRRSRSRRPSTSRRTPHRRKKSLHVAPRKAVNQAEHLDVDGVGEFGRPQDRIQRRAPGPMADGLHGSPDNGPPVQPSTQVKGTSDRVVRAYYGPTKSVSREVEVRNRPWRQVLDTAPAFSSKTVGGRLSEGGRGLDGKGPTPMPCVM
jgi:hypothetical protein